MVCLVWVLPNRSFLWRIFRIIITFEQILDQIRQILCCEKAKLSEIAKMSKIGETEQVTKWSDIVKLNDIAKLNEIAKLSDIVKLSEITKIVGTGNLLKRAPSHLI